MNDYVKPKYGEKAKLCYTDTNSFILYIETKAIYVDISKVVQTRSDSSILELNRSLLKSKKVIGLTKDE